MSVFDPAAVKAALAADAAFNLSLRFLSGTILTKVGEDGYLLEFKDGAFVDFRADDAESADVVLAGPAEAWERMLQEVPAPGCQNPLYNDGRYGASGIQYHGDVVQSVGPFARAIREFSRVLREVVTGKVDDALLPEVDRDFDAAVGRYMYVRIQGIQYRIYFEESGEGSIPLLMQHTAGADGRQMRHILEDPDFRKHFRMIAYDMPFHGKSVPPTSHKWWEQRFSLSKDFLLEMMVAISEKLKLDRPVFLGSAMGGMMALDLAYYLPGKFRATIALNAGPPAKFEGEMRDRLSTFSHPRVSSHWTSSMMVANMSGTSPEIYRRELDFVYSQSAPGVGEGALFYYGQDHDLTPEQAATIDTSKTAVYLFTGEDDFMGTEYGTDLLVKKMNHVPYKRLRRLGHFGAAENPAALKEDIWPVLEEIIANSKAAAEPSTAAAE